MAEEVKAVPEENEGAGYGIRTTRATPEKAPATENIEGPKNPGYAIRTPKSEPPLPKTEKPTAAQEEVGYSIQEPETAPKSPAPRSVESPFVPVAPLPTPPPAPPASVPAEADEAAAPETSRFSPKLFISFGAIVIVGALLVYVLLGFVKPPISANIGGNTGGNGATSLVVPPTLNGQILLHTAAANSQSASILKSLATTSYKQIIVGLYGVSNPMYIYHAGLTDGSLSISRDAYLQNYVTGFNSGGGPTISVASTAKFIVAGIEYDCWQISENGSSANLCMFVDNNVQGTVIDNQSQTLGQTVQVADAARKASER